MSLANLLGLWQMPTFTNVVESTMGPTLPLSPTTSYYIRQILLRNRSSLKFVVAPKAALEADCMADINAVVESLYPDSDEAKAIAKQLERLVSAHQILTVQGEMYVNNVKVIEREICWLLGFKLTSSTPSVQPVTDGRSLLL